MKITRAELDAFVANADAAGGPNNPAIAAFWAGFEYLPGSKVDVTLDPDSEPYFAQMMALYEEIAGRKIDQSVTEMTFPEVDRLVPLESPYADVSPTDRAVHYMRLSKAVHQASLPKGGHVLDMGCGWGLSSEFLAQLGLDVVAVDINPLFVDLVRRRAARLGLKVDARCVSFDAFEAESSSLDAVVFYECLHHAVRPSDLLAKVARWLKVDGKLILAGEPIQNLFWPNWGLRLDPLSVYCIRKFGWFENGWSDRYLKRMLARNGLVPQVLRSDDPVIGTYVVASIRRDLDAKTLATFADSDEWWLENDYLISGRNGPRSTIDFFVPAGASTLELEMHLFRSEPLDVSLRARGRSRSIQLVSGRNDVRWEVDTGRGEVRCEFVFIPWCPDDVLHNGDTRRLGFHLKRVNIA